MTVDLQRIPHDVHAPESIRPEKELGDEITFRYDGRHTAIAAVILDCKIKELGTETHAAVFLRYAQPPEHHPRALRDEARERADFAINLANHDILEVTSERVLVPGSIVCLDVQC